MREGLGREPNEVEWCIIDAEWSEHSSYKSSKALLKLFPTKGERVVLGPGYDAGVIDVGDGLVVTLHIESHNHPSAVDPHGGASTGIGGVLRDILSMGTRPIALIDILRFGDIEKSSHSRWLFSNVVRGIADYGNCVGVPTVAGETEFDESFERNCLVDVACVGVGEKDDLILGEARNPGDVLVLVGGSTGRDGIRGATFASKNLSETAETERSSVQVPDPFTKKLLLDSLIEARSTGLIRGMKDLGGGGLSTALSEVAASGGTGVDVELGRVNLREADMSAAEVMTSESQERMLLILPREGAGPVIRILDKYEVHHSQIGRVTEDGNLTIRKGGEIVARLPASFVVHAPLIPWRSQRPRARSRAGAPRHGNLESSLLDVLSSPNISSMRWVYRQYDHEVGLRTAIKPGQSDAAVLRLPNGRMLAVKGDGNSAQCAIDPYNGSAGCLAEACRNIVAVGAEPVAMVDHLQFGDPSDPEVYWSFSESVRGLADYATKLGIPVVGGKVSFYNEDSASRKAIKPTPIALVVGLIDDPRHIPSMSFGAAKAPIVIVGETSPELGGSEFYRRRHLGGGTVPRVDPARDARLYDAVLDLVREGRVGVVHDCSRGGLFVALSEMCASGGIGATIDLADVPGGLENTADLLFSESHGRFVLSGPDAESIVKVLDDAHLPNAVVGSVGGSALVLKHPRSAKVSKLAVKTIKARLEGTIPRLMD